MSEAWDKMASQFLESKKPESQCYSYYIGNLFRKSTEIGLEKVQSKEISLLKVDLWNEGISPQTDILGKYQNNENYCLYGIDVSKVVCFHAKLRVNKIHVINATIENLPFKANIFNVILDLSTSDHVSENRAMCALQEYKRVLKKKGILVLALSNRAYNSIFGSGIVSIFSRTVRALRKTQDNTLRYYFSKKFVENAKKDFNVLEEHRAGTILKLEVLLNRLPVHMRSSILDSFLALECSKISKSMLKILGGFYIIIEAKSAQ